MDGLHLDGRSRVGISHIKKMHLRDTRQTSLHQSAVEPSKGRRTDRTENEDLCIGRIEGGSPENSSGNDQFDSAS